MAIPAVTTIPPSVTLNPLPAVTIPIESTLVTSSYVNIPAISTLPFTVSAGTVRVLPLNVKLVFVAVVSVALLYNTPFAAPLTLVAIPAVPA